MLLSTTVFVTQSAFAENESLGAANISLIASPSMTELVSFVGSAAEYAKENGKEKALQEFNNKTGSFVNDELYIFAADFKGNVLQIQ